MLYDERYTGPAVYVISKDKLEPIIDLTPHLVSFSLDYLFWYNHSYSFDEKPKFKYRGKVILSGNQRIWQLEDPSRFEAYIATVVDGRLQRWECDGFQMNLGYVYQADFKLLNQYQEAKVIVDELERQLVPAYRAAGNKRKRNQAVSGTSVAKARQYLANAVQRFRDRT